MAEYTVDELLETLNDAQSASGDPRVCEVVNRIVKDLFRAIEELDVQPAEFWAAVKWLNEMGQAQMFGLATAGLGFDRLLDIRADEADLKAGLALGTPRAIEGPLYIAGAPLSIGQARLDDGAEKGEMLVMEGTVRDESGRALRDAVVDVWHANSEGRYSHFDPAQSPYNYRRRIQTDADGRYRFRSVMPVGYAVPPGSPIEDLLKLLGRHGNRPAHIHFLVTAPSHRPLTTQVNIPGDTFIDDDFAFATRDGLIVELQQSEDVAGLAELGVEGRHTLVRFDFQLQAA
jgi:catechol 1,2-dioxygenase